MSDIINKIITIVLIFVLLILAPLLISDMISDMQARRLILNEATQFLDKVTDKGLITEDDLNQFYLSINSHGKIMDAYVKRLIRVAIMPEGELKTVYFTQDFVDGAGAGGDDIELNTGDVVQVAVREIGYSAVRNLVYRILGIDTGSFEFTLAGAVR